MDDNVILRKSMAFALRIIKLYNYLNDEKREYVMSKQVLRCGTRIGAKAHEAHNAESTRDFLITMNQALKDASETEYWLMILSQSGYFSDRQYTDILADCVELKKILTATVKTMKTRVNIDH